ncbi:MAG: MBL fold metallo-hydrolase [Ardenticatenaceae bacterium]
MRAHLLFIGTSDSKGVPRLGCECEVCQRVELGSRDFRTRPALLLSGNEGRILIDTPPELRLRFAVERLPAPDTLFITHSHDDHILGFSDAVNAARLGRRPCPVYAPAEVFAGLRERFGYLWDSNVWRAAMTLHPVERPVTVAGWTLEALRVHHGFNGWAYGYLIQRGAWRGGYFPDAIHVDEYVQARWQGLDLLILGANFWQEQAPPESRSVYDIQEALAVSQTAQISQLILTHLSHKISYDEVAHRLPSWASLAWDGRRVSVVSSQ